MTRAILLFAHGARDPDWARPFVAIRDAVAAAATAVRVELAFLESMSPTLVDAVQQMYGDGIQVLTVVPLFMAQGARHLKRDLPRMLDELRTCCPGLQIDLAPAIGDVPELTGAIARWILGAGAGSAQAAAAAMATAQDPTDDAQGAGAGAEVRT